MVSKKAGFLHWNSVRRATPRTQILELKLCKDPSALTGTFPSQGRQKTHRSSNRHSPWGRSSQAIGRLAALEAVPVRWKGLFGPQGADWKEAQGGCRNGQQRWDRVSGGRGFINILSPILSPFSACCDIAGLLCWKPVRFSIVLLPCWNPKKASLSGRFLC